MPAWDPLSSGLWPWAAASRPEHFLHRRAGLDDLERPADVALVLLARVDAQRLAERAKQVRDRHRPLGHLDAVGVGGADGAAAADAGAGQGDGERLREVVA